PRALADYYEAAVREAPNPKLVSNWIMSELLREIPADDERALAASPIPPPPPRRAPPARGGRHDHRQDREGRVREDAPVGGGRPDDRRPRGAHPGRGRGGARGRRRRGPPRESQGRRGLEARQEGGGGRPGGPGH